MAKPGLDIALMIGKPKGAPSDAAPTEDAPEDLAGEQRTSAAQAVLDAIESKDADALADAFEALLDAVAPEEEAPAEEPAPEGDEASPAPY